MERDDFSSKIQWLLTSFGVYSQRVKAEPDKAYVLTIPPYFMANFQIILHCFSPSKKLFVDTIYKGNPPENYNIENKEFYDTVQMIEVI